LLERAAFVHALLIFFVELRSGLFQRVFSDVLVHHLLVELVEVLMCVVIIELTLMRLDDIGAIGAGTVSQRVLVARVQVALDNTLVLAGRVHLVHESARGRLVLLVARVELGHRRVERFILVDEVLSGAGIACT